MLDAIKAPEVSFQAKLTKMPQVKSELTKSKIWPKSSKNNIFHVSTSYSTY